jgi:putative redox protein
LTAFVPAAGYATSSNCTFTGAQGHELSARLERPDGPIVGTALFAHCFTCGKDLRVERQLTRALTSQGFAVLSFDFTGLGRSGGDFADSSFSADVADLHAAADYLSTTIAPPVLLVGHSLGGCAVLSAAPLLPSVRAIATIGAPADPEHVQRLLDGDLEAVRREGSGTVTIAGRKFTVSRSFLEDLQRSSPRGALADFQGATLFLHAPRDAIVGIDNADELYHAASHPKSFVSLDDADHLLTSDSDAIYVASVIAVWAGRYIGQDTNGQAQPTGYHVEEVTARNHGGYFTTLDTRGSRYAADQELSKGGTERGPTPYDFLAMALAACTSMTLRVYADRKGWSLDTIEVTVRHRRVHADDCQAPGGTCRVDHFEQDIRLPESLTDDQRAVLLSAARRCPVHNTLKSEAEIRTQLTT